MTAEAGSRKPHDEPARGILPPPIRCSVAYLSGAGSYSRTDGSGECDPVVADGSSREGALTRSARSTAAATAADTAQAPLPVGAVGADDAEYPPAVVGSGHAPIFSYRRQPWPSAHETTPSTNGTVGDHLEVAVIGGGQAGLAIGYFLAQQGRDFAILEAADRACGRLARTVGLAEAVHARSLQQPAGLPFPGDPNAYPGRDDVVDYLTEYAAAVHVADDAGQPRPFHPAGRGPVPRRGRRPELYSGSGRGGDRAVPGAVRAADRRASSGKMSSSSTAPGIGRRGPPDGPVLVVGGGNTGFQIAEELSARVRFTCRSGRGRTPLPQRILGRDLFWYLERIGAIGQVDDTRIGRRLAGRDTLIGSDPRTCAGARGPVASADG